VIWIGTTIEWLVASETDLSMLNRFQNNLSITYWFISKVCWTLSLYHNDDKRFWCWLIWIVLGQGP